MIKRCPHLVTLSLLCVAGLFLCACETADPAPREPYPYVAMSPVPPPALVDEEQPVSLEPMSEVWRKGHWTYDGLDFKWEAGAYIMRPHPTAVWNPDRWERRMYGWVYMAGHWR